MSETKKCINCGAELTLNETKFCSNICQHDWGYKEYIKRWKAGKEKGMTGAGAIANQIRKYLFIKHGHKCSKCGWNKVNPVTGNIPLQVEHTDGDYTNNKEDNLDLLCPNCHSLTPTYGRLNAKGRKDRRQSKRVTQKIGKGRPRKRRDA